ncbi:MAG: DUF5666 domain-containing protein [Pseudomonadota bacterium]
MTTANRLLVMTVFAVILGACGGGGGSNDAPPSAGTGGGGSTGGGGGATPGPGTGPVGVELEGGVSGTGLNIGPIQGFSSVIVNGLAMDVDLATIVVDGAVAAESDLREGQNVVVIGDLATQVAERLEYRPLIRGPITALVVTDPLIGTAEATIFGQAVRFNVATFYDGTELEALAVGDVVEVSATRDSADSFVATYVRREPGVTTFQVVGPVTDLNLTNFQIGDLVIDYTSASLENFAGDTIANGDTAIVRGNAADFTAPDQFVAGAVARELTLTLNPEAEVELEGFVTSITGPTAFAVAGQPVVTDADTQFELGDVDDLELNAKLEVAGVLQDDLSLLAEDIVFRPLQAVRAEGPIEAVDLIAETVTVLGVTFEVRGTTELEDERDGVTSGALLLVDLAVGDQVEVRGFLEDAAVVAVELNRDDPSTEAALRAPLTVFDAVAGTLSLFDVALETDGNTEYAGQDDDELTLAEFFALLETGLFVEASWENYVSTAIPVDELSVEDDD